MTTDPIADMITRMRNSISRRLEKVTFPYSNIKKGILEVLQNKGMIEKFEVVDTKSGKKSIEVYLKYVNGKPAITTMRRISKPGRRVYTDYRTIPVVKNNYGFMILSTSKGIKDTFTAKKEQVGGEIMCEIF